MHGLQFSIILGHASIMYPKFGSWHYCSQIYKYKIKNLCVRWDGNLKIIWLFYFSHPACWGNKHRKKILASFFHVRWIKVTLVVSIPWSPLSVTLHQVVPSKELLVLVRLCPHGLRPRDLGPFLNQSVWLTFHLHGDSPWAARIIYLGDVWFKFFLIQIWN